MYDFLDKIGLKAVLEAIKGKMSEYASKALYGDTTINVGRLTDSAVGEHSTAEGEKTTASGRSSHAEGLASKANGDFSHAEGSTTKASGVASHAEGALCYAIGGWSHAEGYGTIANNVAEHASGKFNVSNEDTLFSVGDGTSSDNRHNAFEITKTGGRLHDKNIATTDLIPTTLPANGGNADTVNGRHAYRIPTLDANANLYDAKAENINDAYLQWDGTRYFKLRTFGGNLTAVDYATNAGNADTVDDIHIHCVNDGTSGLSWFAVFGATNDIRAVDPARAYVGSSGGVTGSLIGTASGCQYSTILAWANAQTTSTFASVVAASGFPSDAPYQQEALLQVQVDYYHQRKIVTWTRYLGGQAPQIRQRAIFGTDWNDSDWRVVCG